MAEDKEIWVDGHIHFYNNFDPERFFGSLRHNFNRLSSEDAVRVLLFTEGKSADYFELFKANPEIYREAGYVFEATEEKSSLLLRYNGEAVCHIVQGRQIVTAENIEILSIGTSNIIPDGNIADDVLKELEKKKIPAVLAWGFGKWFSGRGKLVKRLISEFSPKGLLIGDNSGRPVFWGTPKLFRYASEKGFSLIAGSDPLPLNNEEKKVASYGFQVNATFDPARPTQSIHRILNGEKPEFFLFGKRDGVFAFFIRQFKMFLRKHLS